MMYNTRYLPENFDQCRLEKTILRQFPYDLSVRSSWNALIQDGGKYHEKAYWYWIFESTFLLLQGGHFFSTFIFPDFPLTSEIS